jgi:hypothetical protein
MLDPLKRFGQWGVEFLNTRLTVVNNSDLKKINQAQIAKQNYGIVRFSIGNVLSLPPKIETRCLKVNRGQCSSRVLL